METQAKYVWIYGHAEFKSYYVVWKHSPKGIKDFCASSLNRTMQYGNPGSSEEDSKEAYV